MTLLTDQDITANDPRLHAASIKNLLAETMRHIREEVGELDDPEARALFGTTAEVLQGLWNACDRYQRAAEDVAFDEELMGE